MPLCDNIKSLICTPTDKCCQKLCRKRKREEDDEDGEYHSTMRKLLDKITYSMHSHTLSKHRKPTGWSPPQAHISEDSELSDDDDDPNENKWKKKQPVVFPLIITSTTTFNEQADINNPVKSAWENKDAAIFSATTTSGAKPSRYSVQSNLQYVLVLPADKPHRSSPMQQTMNIVSVDEKPPSIIEKTVSYNAEPTPKRMAFFSEDPVQKQEFKKGSFDSAIDYFDSESQESFEPRSKAKPAKPKKGMCCTKRQDSQDSSNL